MARHKEHPFRAVFREDPLGWTCISDQGYGAGYVGVIHKREMEGRRFRFANEWICGHLAQYLLLPIPPFAITYFESQEEISLRNAMLFSSMDFDYERDAFPLADFDICYARFPDLCAGILVFDILIANPDRRLRNIWCDDTANPTRLFIFDHDYALFGDNTEGVPRIQAIRASDSLGLHFADEGTNRHPFLKLVASATLFDDWFRKLALMPRWLVEQVASDAAQYGIEQNEAEAATDFLLHRSRNLEAIVKKHKADFTAITEWSEFMQ